MKMALWDRKIYWQFGGNVQPVRMNCEVDWKSCPSTILNYLWSEIVTDVIDYVTLNDGILWRVITLICCLLIIIYTLWTKIMETIENVMKEQIFNGINFKLQNLEMRVNVLAYRMQYGTWPLPHNIDTNSAIIKAGDNQSIELFNFGGHYSWLSKLIPKYILKNKNLKFYPTKSSSLKETPSGDYDDNFITQKIHSKYKSHRKCVKCSQSNKRLNIKCHAPQKQKSMEIQYQGRMNCNELSNDNGRIEIPLKFLSSSPNIAKLFTSTKITLAKVRQRLESLHTVLKIYRSEQGINLTKEKTGRKVNLLDSFLQELSDLQSGTDSDEHRIQDIPKNFEILETNFCISNSSDNTNPSIQTADNAQCKDADMPEIQSSSLSMHHTNKSCFTLNEIDVMENKNSYDLENFQEHSEDLFLAGSKNCYPLQILDSIVEEQSGNSCNEQPVETNSLIDNYVNVDTNSEDEINNFLGEESMLIEESTGANVTPNSVATNCAGIVPIEELCTTLDNESYLKAEQDVEIIGGNENNFVEEEEEEEYLKAHGIMSKIIICSSTLTHENLTNHSIIPSDSCCSAFMKLEKIKFDALTEVEKVWTDELFVDKHRECIEKPLLLRNWLTNTGINFTLNVSSDEVSGSRIACLKDITDTDRLEYSDKTEDRIKDKPELQLVVKDFPKLASTDNIAETVIEKPKYNEISFISTAHKSLDNIEANSINNLSKSSIDLSQRKSRLCGASKYETSPKRLNTPPIFPASRYWRYKINTQHRSSSLDSAWKTNRSKSGIPVLKTRYYQEPSKANDDRYNTSPHRAPLTMSVNSPTSGDILDHSPSKEPNEKSTCSNENENKNHPDRYLEEQTIVYINIINEQHDNSLKMENSQECSDYIKENIFKIRGLTEYIKNSGVSKIVTIVCSTASQNTDNQSKDIEVVPCKKFVIDTSTLV